MAFSLDSKVKDILKNPAAAAVLDKYSPDASKNPQMKLSYFICIHTGKDIFILEFYRFPVSFIRSRID